MNLSTIRLFDEDGYKHAMYWVNLIFSYDFTHNSIKCRLETKINACLDNSVTALKICEIFELMYSEMQNMTLL